MFTLNSRHFVFIAFYFICLSANAQVSIDFETTAIVNSEEVILHKYGIFSKGGFSTSINIKLQKWYVELGTIKTSKFGKPPLPLESERLIAVITTLHLISVGVGRKWEIGENFHGGLALLLTPYYKYSRSQIFPNEPIGGAIARGPKIGVGGLLEYNRSEWFNLRIKCQYYIRNNRKSNSYGGPLHHFYILPQISYAIYL